MKIVRRLFDDAIVLSTPRFEDARGVFIVSHESTAASALGLPTFVQDNHSLSTKSGTIRGLHLQLPPYAQAKLVRVPVGSVADVLVDLRPGSETVGQYEVVELSARNGHQLFIPAGFGHGFCTLEPNTHVQYKVDKPYRPEAERTLAWDDPQLGINWPVEGTHAVLSEKDTAGEGYSAIMDSIGLVAQ